MNTAEILRAAAQRVRQGWCQHNMEDSSGGVCAIGAVCDVMFGDPWHIINMAKTEPDFIAVRLALAEPMLSVFGEMREVKDWNNGTGQTAENVAQGLELAALLWEQGQAQHAEPVSEPQLA